jgi:membrane protein
VLGLAVGTAFLGTWEQIQQVSRISGFVLSWVVASGLLFLSARILCRRKLRLREVGPGSVIGGAAMTVLITISSRLVATYVAGASAVYGVVSTVVGFISLLFLVSNAIVFSMEISVVYAWQLWPRGIDINVLFPADERAYVLLTLTDERMPSQRNGVSFDATGHDDPRRPDLALLHHRVPGMPRTPYDATPG